jgi:hypothetical protein
VYLSVRWNPKLSELLLAFPIPSGSRLFASLLALSAGGGVPFRWVPFKIEGVVGAKCLPSGKPSDEETSGQACVGPRRLLGHHLASKSALGPEYAGNNGYLNGAFLPHR